MRDTCDERDRGATAELAKAHPLLLVEVLSPSTSGHDHGVKFASYRKLPSLRECVLIDCERRLIEVFRKDVRSTRRLRWPGRNLSVRACSKSEMCEAATAI